MEIRAAKEVKFEALSGELAESSLATVRKEKEELFARLRNKKGGGRGGKKNGNFGNRKNKKITFDDEPEEKKAKVEEAKTE